MRQEQKIEDRGWRIENGSTHEFHTIFNLLFSILSPPEGVKELSKRLEHVPPRTTGGTSAGGAENPHQVLIQQLLPPSSPPLEKGGRSESNELLQGLAIFSQLQEV